FYLAHCALRLLVGYLAVRSFVRLSARECFNMQVHPVCSLFLILSGQKLFGIDGFGWGVILSLLLLLGIPYTRYFLRRADIPEWPIISARVEKAEALPGPPREIYPAPVPLPFPATPAKVVPYHCRVCYVYLAEQSLYEGSFALLARNAEEAHGLADALQDQTILVKYNPRNPKDSVAYDERILDKKVLQEGENPLNPRVL